MPDMPEVKPGQVIAGKYRIDRVIAEGGMGVVVAAANLALGQPLALKFILPGLLGDPETAERFVREARAVAALKSEHVVRIYDVVRPESGTPFIVMELLDGVDLGTHVAQTGPLDPAVASEYVLQALEGLGEAHARGIVHRDLKPHNLFLTQGVDGEPCVKLIDFGIAKTLRTPGEQILTATHAVMGSVGYMSPEQIDATHVVDARTDIWSLGVILYELVMGRRPFAGETFSTIVYQIASVGMSPLPSSIRPDYAAVIRTCLEKHPDHRFQSVADLADALAPIAGEIGRVSARRIQRIIQSQSGKPARHSAPTIRATPFPPLPTMRTVAGGADQQDPPGNAGASRRSSENLEAPPAAVAGGRTHRLPSLPRRVSARLVLAASLVVVVGISAWWLARRSGAAPVAASLEVQRSQTIPSAVPQEHVLRLCGSNTIGAELAPALMQAFLAARGSCKSIERTPTVHDEMSVKCAATSGPALTIHISAHGTGTAFKGLVKGDCDIGMASRQINDNELRDLRNAGLGNMRSTALEHVIGLDGVAVIVNAENRLSQLDVTTLGAIFAGEQKVWRPVGGTGGAINLYARDDKSGTFDTFKHLVLGERKLSADAARFEDSEALSDAVAKDPNGIGFVGLPYVRTSKALSVAEAGADAFLPTTNTVRTEDYVLSRRLYLYGPRDPADRLASEFVEFAKSNAGQMVVGQVGFVNLVAGLMPAPTCNQCPSSYRASISHARRLGVNFRFDTGSNDLDNRAARDIERLIARLDEPDVQGKEILLFGFADSVGSAAISQRLSLDRGNAIAEALRRRGVRISFVEGFGSAMPVGDNRTEDGRRRNRRVEVWLR